ncbi:MAG: hypothetical protein WA092_01975 [Minisyncoccales bacterium]
MAESTGGRSCGGKEKYPRQGIIHWVIEPRCYNIDHIEIWGENVQKVENLNELFGQRVFVRTFMKNDLSNRFLSLFKKEPEPIQTTETATIKLIGHDGNIPIIEIGSRKLFAHVITKIIDWPGYEYPPFKKAPK